MYFLWKKTPHGSIRISCDGLSGFFSRILSDKSKCRGLTLIEGEEAFVTLVLSSGSLVAEKLGVEERIASIAAPLGFRMQFIWVDRGAPEAEWCETLSSIFRSPWTWMVVVSAVALGIMAGMKGLFWTLFWGAAAWFVAKLALSFFSPKKIVFLRP